MKLPQHPTPTHAPPIAYNCRLGWDDDIVDGFYSAFGDFPELDMPPNQLPRLEDLKR